MLQSIERKDATTAAHTWRVVLYTRTMAERAGLKPEFIERLTHAAALHDIGKLEIPDEILQKPGKLTDVEYAVIQTHSAAGHAWLKALGETDELVLQLVRHHHERMDGTGYPDHLQGDEIPEPARYFAVIDSFDALTSVRPYRTDVGAAAAERAIVELNSKRETWYCDESVDLLTDLYRSGAIDWILDYCNDRCELPPHRPASPGVFPTAVLGRGGTSNGLRTGRR